MMTATPPIIVFSDDLETFPSIAAMLAYIEPIDAADVRAVFDAEGRRLVLRTEGVKTQRRWGVGGGRVWVEQDGALSDLAALDSMLRGELSARYERFGFTDDVVAGLDHEGLINAAVRLTGHR